MNGCFSLRHCDGYMKIVTIMLVINVWVGPEWKGGNVR